MYHAWERGGAEGPPAVEDEDPADPRDREASSSEVMQEEVMQVRHKGQALSACSLRAHLDEYLAVAISAYAGAVSLDLGSTRTAYLPTFGRASDAFASPSHSPSARSATFSAGSLRSASSPG